MYIYVYIKPGLNFSCGILVINLSSNRDRFDNGVYGQDYRSQREAARNYSRGKWKL